MPSLRSAVPAIAVALLVILGLANCCFTAEEKPNPVVAQVKAALKDVDKPFTLVVHIQVKKGSGKKFEAAFARAAKPTRKEKGCLTYDLNHDAKNPANYLVYERWRNLAALDAHLKSEHITRLFKDIGELLAAPPNSDVMLPVGE